MNLLNMANSGLQQATIMYRVSKIDGAPLDINGELTSISGLKQAIYLLVGYANPNPALFQVMGYYPAHGSIAGVPTYAYNMDACPVFPFWTDPTTVELVEVETDTITLYSALPWSLVSINTIATVTPTSGGTGFYSIVFTKTATQGEETFIFRNSLGAQISVNVINVDNRLWILADGTWNSLGFWYNTETWNTI